MGLAGLAMNIPQGIEVVKQLDPPAAGDGSLGLAVVVLPLVILSLVHLVLRWMARRGWINPRVLVLGAAIGNALMELHTMLEPQRPAIEHRIEAEKPASRSTADGGPDPHPTSRRTS